MLLPLLLLLFFPALQPQAAASGAVGPLQSSAQGWYPAPRLMTAAERRSQVAERGTICNSSAVVVASCWGFDPLDSTEFLQAALVMGGRVILQTPFSIFH